MRLRTNWLVVIIGLTIVAAASILAVNGYEDGRSRAKAEAMTGGNVARGRLAFARYGCGGCHRLSGVAPANGRVGPPLDGIGARATIAGRLANEPGNLERWIQNPRKVTPGTAMPDLGVTPADARDLAAFLYSRT
ncbi:MAG TPA: c-type cytochrome [Allosphingosinicella sp.]|jgi:cytochrome c2